MPAAVKADTVEGVASLFGFASDGECLQAERLPVLMRARKYVLSQTIDQARRVGGSTLAQHATMHVLQIPRSFEDP